MGLKGVDFKGVQGFCMGCTAKALCRVLGLGGVYFRFREKVFRMIFFNALLVWALTLDLLYNYEVYDLGV